MTTANLFATIQKSSLDNFARIADAQLAGTKKLANLNLALAREFVDESAKSVQSIATAKAPEPVFGKLPVDVQALADKSAAYSKSVYEIISSVANEIKAVAEAQAAEISQQVASAVDSAAKNAPAGSEPMFAFAKSVVSGANRTYEQISTVEKKVKSTAEAGLATAFATAEESFAKA